MLRRMSTSNVFPGIPSKVACSTRSVDPPIATIYFIVDLPATQQASTSDNLANMPNPSSKLGLLASWTIIAALFLPRIVTEGLFMDGLAYAIVARNLAEGYGSWWKPWCSAWFERDAFYEHPPFQFWAQSPFFRLLGDHWWVEKLYSTLALLCTVVAIHWIWRLLFGRDRVRQSLGWLAVVLWYLTPTITWGMPCNMLENTLTPLCLLATGCCLLAQQRPQQSAGWLIFSGLVVLAAFLTKGPVALFPLAAPFAAAYAFSRPTFRNVRSLLHLLLPALAFALALGLLWLHEPARDFLQNYWQTQVVRSLNGSRETSDGGLAGHLLLVHAFFTAECLPAFATVALLWLLGKKHAVTASRNMTPETIFAGLVFLSATLPMLISAKQRTYYLMPAIPWLAIFLAAWVSPFANAVGQRMTAKIQHALRLVCFAALVVVAIFSITTWGTPGRDADQLRIVQYMQTVVPYGETVGVCSDSYYDYQTNAYLQRYGRWEISTDVSACRFAVINTRQCSPEFQAAVARDGWIELLRSGERVLYGRK